MIPKENTYKLYASFLSDEVLEAVSKQRFGRITPDYVLVYTNERKPKGFFEISENESYRLTKQDKKWLFDCNIVIISEYKEESDDGFFYRVSDEIEKLDVALKKEAEILSKGGNSIE